MRVKSNTNSRICLMFLMNGCMDEPIAQNKCTRHIEALHNNINININTHHIVFITVLKSVDGKLLS